MSMLSTVLIAVFVLLSVSHLVIAYHRIIRRRPGYSSVPLVNGIIGALGFLLSPSSAMSSLWWMPFLLDWGCLPLLIEIIVSRTRTRGDHGPESKETTAR